MILREVICPTFAVAPGHLPIWWVVSCGFRLPGASHLVSVLHTVAAPDDTRLPIWWTVSCGFRLPGTWSVILREVICPTFAVAPWRDENHRRLPVLDACLSLS